MSNRAHQDWCSLPQPEHVDSCGCYLIRGEITQLQMTNITKNTINKVTDYYHVTTKSTGVVSYIIKALQDNIGEDLKSALADATKKRNSRKVVKDMKAAFNAVATLLRGKAKQVFLDLSVLAEEHANTLPPTIEDLTLPSEERVEKMLSDMTGASKAIATLIWNGGFKLEDLARDKHQLSRVGKGLVSVTGNFGSTQARKVTSDNSFGLTPEMVKDLLPILRGKLFSSEQLGLDVLLNIHPYTNGWEFTPSQLRAAHAERLVSQGMSFAEVADIQGVRPETIRNRQRKYRKAN